MEPFTDTIAAALAERNGSDPEDPEVWLTAVVIGGIVLIRQRSFQRHAASATSLGALARGIERDLERAIRAAKPALDAFDGLRDGRRSSRRKG
jgi:hypothetical protein